MYKTGEQGVSERWNSHRIKALFFAFSRHKQKFILLQEFALPDNSTLYLYKKKNEKDVGITHYRSKRGM